MAGEDEIIKTYVDRVMRLKDRSSLGQAELDAVARELGLSEMDFARIDAEVAGHRLRGRRFMGAGRFADALAELDQALSLRPMDPGLIHALALVNFRMAQGSGDLQELAEAEKCCKRAVELDPAQKASYELLARIDRERGQHGRKRTALRKKIGAVAAAAVLGAALAIAIAMTADRRPVPAAPETPAPIEAPSAPPPVPAAPLSKTEWNVPVTLVPSPEAAGIGFQSQLSTVRDMGKSYSYYLKGALSVRGDELKRLTLKLECLDASGRLAASKYINALQDHEPIARPGDAVLVGALIYEEREAPDIASARVSISYILRSAAQADYPADPAVPVVWDRREQSVDVAVFERSNRIAMGAGYSSFLTLCVQNTGKRALSVVRLKIDWYDAADRIIASTLAYAVTDASTAQLPVGARVSRLFIGKLPSGVAEFDRYVVTVAEAH